MKLRAFKYLSPFLLYLAAFRSFASTGWEIWIPAIYAFGVIPLLELFIQPNANNLNVAEEEVAKSDKIYDLLLYLVVPLQYLALTRFLDGMIYDELTTIEIAGRVTAMGILCGVFGINVAHELGHRVNKFEQGLAKALLLTSLYMHFFTEHNKGHHKRVATPEDPSSARFGEPVYIFYFRTIIFSYISAWHIANDEMRKKGNSVFSLKNEMVQFTFTQLAFLCLIFFLTSWLVTLYFITAAFIGILLLETVNYIEHYGLQRKELCQNIAGTATI